jgi:hypothetical protein
MAPAIGIGHTDASLKAIHIPVGIVAGGADDVAKAIRDDQDT